MLPVWVVKGRHVTGVGSKGSPCYQCVCVLKGRHITGVCVVKGHHVSSVCGKGSPCYCCGGKGSSC